jgi:SM-20-related protein
MGNALPAAGAQGTCDGTTIFERIASDIYRQGYCLLNDAIPEDLCRVLFERVTTLKQTEFMLAGIGRAQDQMLNSFVRRDEIRWLEAGNPAEQGWLDWIEQLRVYLNRRLLLGLFSYEGHFAHYAPGAFYKKHFDAFKGEGNRVLTVVFYLNPGWQPEEGGEMLMFRVEETEPFERILPQMGRMAVFLSEEFPHEVLPAKRDRYSIAGWYRINATTAERVDPPR